MIPLSQSAIASYLPSYYCDLIEQWHLLSEVGSTNQYLSQQQHDVSSAALCVAESQLAGRGRHGRSWVASPNSNIMMSLSWRFSQLSSQLSILSLGAAVGIAKALNTFGVQVKIKWPNDIYLNDAKLGGLLLDVHSSPPNNFQIIIGLGLNVQILPKEAELIDQTWIDLYSAIPDWESKNIDRNQLIAAITQQWLTMLLNFPTNQNTIIEQWHQYAQYLNQPVLLLEKNSLLRREQGVMRGTNKEGHLLIENASGAINSYIDSNLSLRPADHELKAFH